MMIRCLMLLFFLTSAAPAFAADTAAPTVPTALVAYNLKDTSFSFKWTPSTDAIGVNYYHIDIATSSTFYAGFLLDGWNNKWQPGGYPQIAVSGLVANTTYYVRIWATDAAGNASARSATLVVKTTPPIPTGDLFIKNVEYNEYGQMTRVEYGNGDVTTNTYNPLNFRLTRIITMTGQDVKVQDLSYQYDSVGNITKISDEAMPSGTQRFVYDEFNRLISATGNQYGTKTYQYDQIGNITEKDGKTYFYAEGGAGVHAVTRLGDGTVFTYDQNGNMLTQQKGSDLTLYGYDASDQFISVKKNGATIASYEYDATGGRTKKTAESVTTVFMGQMYEQTGTVKTKVVFLNGQKAVSIVGDQILYTHSDHLGGANVVTDEAGNVKEITEYAPFGEIARQDRYGTPEETARWYFAGHYLDQETGLTYMGARYYSSSLGRFITADPTIQNPAIPATLNRYSYAGNNPINRWDPSGYGFWDSVKKWFKQTWQIAAAVLVTMLGQPWLGAIIIAGIATAVNGGGFKDFAISVGVGFASGWAGGYGAGWAGGTAKIGGQTLTMAVMRGAAAGAIAGAGMAAIYGGDIGQGALLGAGVGALTASMVWKVNDNRTNAFLEKINWDKSVTPEFKAKIIEAFKAYGQSPIGARMIEIFMGTGKPFTFTANGGYGGPARVFNNTMAIKNLPLSNFTSDGRTPTNFAEIVAHEFHHLSALHGLPDMTDAQARVHWEANKTHPIYDPQNVAYSENPYLRWMGREQITSHHGDSVPMKMWLFQ